MAHCGAIRMPFPAIFHISSTGFNLLFARRCRRRQFAPPCLSAYPPTIRELEVPLEAIACMTCNSSGALLPVGPDPLDAGQKGVPNSVWVLSEVVPTSHPFTLQACHIFLRVIKELQFHGPEIGRWSNFLHSPGQSNSNSGRLLNSPTDVTIFP